MKFSSSSHNYSCREYKLEGTTRKERVRKVGRTKYQKPLSLAVCGGFLPLNNLSLPMGWGCNLNQYGG